jgi:hypothetical protein
MSLSRDQQILLKQAQAQSGIDDTEYREFLESVTALFGCHSSSDPRLTDAHLDNLISFFEAIYWHGVDSHTLRSPQEIIDTWYIDHPRATKLPTLPFRERGFWATRNTRGNTSRDRYSAEDVQSQIRAAEGQLVAMGFGFRYLQAIQNKIVPFDGWKYLAALKRTIAWQKKKRTNKRPRTIEPF